MSGIPNFGSQINSPIFTVFSQVPHTVLSLCLLLPLAMLAVLHYYPKWCLPFIT